MSSPTETPVAITVGEVTVLETAATEAAASSTTVAATEVVANVGKDSEGESAPDAVESPSVKETPSDESAHGEKRKEPEQSLPESETVGDNADVPATEKQEGAEEPSTKKTKTDTEEQESAQESAPSESS